MPTEINEKNYSAFKDFCSKDNFGARVFSAYKYDKAGLSSLTMLSEGKNGEIKCVFSLKGDTAVAAGSMDEETAQCLRFAGTRYVFAEENFYDGAAVLSSGSVGILNFPDKNLFPAEPINAENLRDIFDLIKVDLPENDRTVFGNWYVELSHKLRHGETKISVVRKDNKPVSIAMTMAETDRSAVIGSVRTLNEYTGRGYAKAVCGNIADRLLAEDKKIFICAEDNIFPFYEKIGYKKYSKWWYCKL